jgi:hypothetical protein
MIFSLKVYDSVYLTDSSSDSDNDMGTLDEYEIRELEQKLISNYKLLQNNKMKYKKKDNYLLESLSNKYQEMNNVMKKEHNKLTNHLQLLNKYIKQNKANNKKILFLLENEKKNIKKELKKIKSIQNI